MSKSIATKRLIRSSGTTVSSPDRKSSDEGQEQYVGSFAALIDKYVQYIVSGKGIPIGIMLVVMVLVFIQDNRAGRLQTGWGLFWFVLKCFLLMSVYLIYCAGRRMVRLIKKRHRETTKKPKKES